MKGQSIIKASAVYLIFTVSGASALVYQVLWARWLGLVLGNTTLSVSIVLGSFMAGLALGSWLAGRFLDNIRNPLLSYAYVEFGIGIFALCFPTLAKLAESVFVAAVNSESSTVSGIAVRVLLSGGLLLIPTTLMGTTLPFLADFFHRSPSYTKNWRVGLLYAANTLGAAIGISIASFILIELIGIRSTTFVAAGLNFFVAAVGYRFSRSFEVETKQVAIVGGERLSRPGRFAIVIVTASGALALASEVLWTRTLETLIGNSTYAFASIVLLYLLGIAAGSWIMSLVVNRLKNLPLWIVTAQLLMGIWVLVSVWLFQGIIDSIAKYGTKMVQLTTIFAHYLEVMIVLLPLSLLSGACFPLATRIVDPEDEDAKGTLVARVYAWNTVGALVGSLAAGFIIAPLWDYFNSLFILAALYCLTAAAAFAFIAGSRWQISLRIPAAVVLGTLSVVLAVLLFIKAGDKNYYQRRLESRYPDYKVVFHEPGIQGVTTAIKHPSMPNMDILLVNGMGMTRKATDTKMMAHLPMLLHPNPENTLVICLGMGTTYRSALAYGKRVTVVELVKEVADALDYFYEDAAALKAHPGGRIVVNDGRSFLNITKDTFDVITIDPPPPIDAAGVNNLYSKEFLELARKHLKKGGIMAHWMPLPGTMSGVDDLETLSRLVRTFAQVFPYTYFRKSIHNIGLHVIGSMEPIMISPDAVRNNLANKKVLDDISEWDKVPSEYFSTGWILFPPPDLVGPVITDDEPFLEFYLLRTLRTGGKKTHPVSYW